MKAIDKVRNTNKINDIKESINKIKKQLKVETDYNIIEDLKMKEEILQDDLNFELNYCIKCSFYESDINVGINPHCEHEYWYKKDGSLSEYGNNRMIKQMDNSKDCIYFKMKS